MKPSSAQKGNRKENEKDQAPRVQALHVTVVSFFIVVVAIACGLFSYYSLSAAENKNYREQLDYIATAALERLSLELSSQSANSAIVAEILSSTYPNETEWPFVYMSNFGTIADRILETSVSTEPGIGYFPIVQLEQSSQFESWVAEKYKNDPLIPEGTGNNSFGFGIFGLDWTSDAPDFRFHDVSGTTQDFNTSFNVLLPGLLYSNVNVYGSFFLFNFFGNRERGEAMNCVLECSLQTPGSKMCTSVSRPMILPGLSVEPTLLLFQPIYSSSGSCVGVTSSGFKWSFLLTNAFPRYLAAVDVVIKAFDGQTGTLIHQLTYEIRDGMVVRETTKEKKRDHRLKIESLIFNSSNVAVNSPVYTAAVYPGQETEDQYTTYQPLYYSLFTGGMVVVIAIVFLIYDKSVRRQFREKQALIEAKRTFVRFISHEVRTPMNTVYLGLTALWNEINVHLRQLRSCSSEENENELERKHQDTGSYVAYDYDAENSSSAVVNVGDAAQPEMQTKGSDVQHLPATSLSSLESKGLPPPPPAQPAFPAIITTTSTSTSLHDNVAAAGKINLSKQKQQEGGGRFSLSAVSLEQQQRRQQHIAALEKVNLKMENWSHLVLEIMEHTEEAVHVLNDLLNYDKIEMGKLELEYTQLNLSKVMRAVVHPFQLAAKLKQIDLKIEVNYSDLCPFFPSPSERRNSFESYTSSNGGKRRGSRPSSPRSSSSPSYTRSEAGAYNNINDSCHSLPDAENQFDSICCPFVVKAVGDNVKMGQAIQNLISNAIKFSPENGTVIVRGKRNPVGVHAEHAHWQKSQFLDADQKATLNALRPYGTFIISVADNGAGLSPEQLKLIGSEGVQFNVNSLQAGQGSGLGLCITKGLVDLHGGAFTVESAGLGRGSTFIIELPLYTREATANEMMEDEDLALEGVSLDYGEVPTAKAREEKEESSPELTLRNLAVATTEPGEGDTSKQSALNSASTAAASARLREQSRSGNDPTAGMPPINTAFSSYAPRVAALSSAPHSITTSIEAKGQKILVVDDSRLNRSMAVRVLTSLGHTCEQAADGSEAIKKVEACDPEQPFSTILMDYEMPVLNGPDATAKLRSMGVSCLIVGVSGNVLVEDVRYFKSKGADFVLPKPLNVLQLEECWKQTL